jgi:hypothetical protein
MKWVDYTAGQERPVQINQRLGAATRGLAGDVRRRTREPASLRRRLPGGLQSQE